MAWRGTTSPLFVVCFLLGNSPTSEFYMPTFRNTLFHLHRQVGVKWLNLRIVGVSIQRKVGSKIAWADWKEGDRVGVESGYKAGSERSNNLQPPCCVVTPFTTCFVTGPTPSQSPSFQSAQAIFKPTFSLMDTPTILKFSHSTPIRLWRWNRQIVPKRQHIKFRCWGITQKKTYNIQNTVKVWNQENVSFTSYKMFTFCHICSNIS
jgi:hypothetical protein